MLPAFVGIVVIKAGMIFADTPRMVSANLPWLVFAALVLGVATLLNSSFSAKLHELAKFDKLAL